MGETACCDLWDSERVVICWREREICDLWEIERVVICRIDCEMRRMPIETIIAKYLLFNVQHVSALIMGFN